MIEAEKQKKDLEGNGDSTSAKNALLPDAHHKRERPKISFNPLASYKGVFKRLLILYRHVIGLIIGAQVAQVRNLPEHKRKGLHSPFSRTYAFFLKIFIKKEFRKKPFEIQLRRRLEILGPTYIKLGQIMAIREDILPQLITDELKQLLDKLPEIPFEYISEIIEKSLQRPIHDVFMHIEEHPVGTASIAQVHMATTNQGENVVLKVIKPHIRETILSDIKLLKILGNFLAFIIPQYQPKTIIEEFCRYTEKEVDLTYEADHSDMFNANFSEYEDVVFPKIYREYSSEDVLCMEFFDGVKPNDPAVFELYDKKEIHKIVDLGTGSIIKMLYQDGFFHADLHAGNLIVLPGPKVGFIDVGMVGRFDQKIKYNMLYYFYYLVNDDIENSAKFLFSMATLGKNGDGIGFKRAVIDLSNRFRLQAAYGNFSIAKLILESLSIGAKYHVFFPVEMTLMVKALVTFEGVGIFLDPNLDIPSLSQRHIELIYKERYNPKLLGQHVLQAVPEMVDLIMRLPEIIHNTTRFWESTIDDNNNSNPMAGLRSGLIAGSCIVGGVIALVQGSDPYLWILLFSFGIGITLFGKS